MGSLKTTRDEGLKAEYQGVKLGDFRLEQRLRSMVRAFEGEPARSFPEALRDSADIEAGYRFLRNAKVSLDKLVEPHIERTRERAEQEAGVLVLHDTSEALYRGEARREGLHREGGKQGFLAHVALTVSAEGKRRPLGVIGIETLTHVEKVEGETIGRTATRTSPARESQRWRRLYRQTKGRLANCDSVLHVMDREGDFYEMLAEMVRDGSRFVVRNLHDRLLAPEVGKPAEKLREAAAEAEVLVRREVSLSSRRAPPMPKAAKTHPGRASRMAKLAIGATRICVSRPKFADRGLPATIELNVVVVREENAPQGAAPIDWVLLTTEPVGTVEQLEAVVDAYRTRWVIEEFFKALKTGCGLETRQLESSRTILNALGFLLPMAWDLLCIRTLAESDPTAPATELLAPERMLAFRAIYRQELGRKLPPRLSASRLILAIAELGGFLKNNGRRPGWQVLARGFYDFLQQERGWLIARA